MILKTFTFDPILIDSCFLRRGILLKITGQEGEVAKTEISPLPGHSKETLEDALLQFQNVKRRLLTTWWSLGALHNLESLGLYPSVYFGIENALLQLIDPVPKTSCKSYALLLGATPEEILQRAEDAYNEGMRQAKVKIGHLQPEIAKPLVDELLKRFTLRLDVNRRWQNSKAFEFFKNYHVDDFVYIEEPLKDLNELGAFPLPFALDESLREYGAEPFLHCDMFTTVVIKPTLEYPIDPLLDLNKNIVITSSFEGAIGIQQIQNLITRLDLNNTYHGLDTFRYFQEPNHDIMSHCVLEHSVSS